MIRKLDEQINEYKDKLNKAIINIILEPTKKETKEEHKFVKENGYEVYKWAGNWHVKNPKTNKSISGRYKWTYQKGQEIEIKLYGYKNKYFKNKEKIKIDIVGYLNKPINKEYISINDKRTKQSKAYEQYQMLESLKWAVNYYKELQEKKYNEILKKLDEIRKIQDDVQKEMEREREAKRNLEKYKEKIGLRI